MRMPGNKRGVFGNGTAAILLLAAVLLVAFQGTALSRSGGGEQFGEDRGSDGSSGDSGDLFGLVLYLLPFMINHPVIGIPLLIVIVVVFLFLRKRGASFGARYRTVEPPLSPPPVEAEPGAVETIRKRDPAFSEESFLSRAGTAFMAIQKAWSEQDLSSAGHFISSGVRERFETQIFMQKAQGYRNDLEDIEIVSSELADAFSDAHFDALCVGFTARMKDRYIDLKTGETIKENPDTPFTEYWTFLRRPGAKTLDKGGLVEGRCPNCGAEISLTDTGHCNYCKAFISSGEYDWLLVKIDQEDFPPEHRTGSKPPGIEEFAARDPAFSRAGMEDRVSVIYWKIVRTFFTGDASELRGCTLPSFQKEIQPLLAPDVSGRRRFEYEAAVGNVSLAGIIPERGDGMDQVDVLVTSSSRNAWIENGGVISGVGNKEIRRLTYRLVRKSGVKTLEKSSFRVVPCQKCGAPDDGNKEGKCPYCAAPTNEGDRDWVLEDVGGGHQHLHTADTD